MLSGKKILLGITGGIAAYKIATLVRLFKKSGAEVKVIMTPDAKQFITPLTISTLSEEPVLSEFSDSNWETWNNHVEIALWADVFVIAPLTANTLAKMATGISDNLLMAVYLSAKCPVYVAPAMDLDMYKHSTTKSNLKKISSNGIRIIEAKIGELASGLTGEGRMEEPEEIHKVILDHFEKGRILKGKKVLITAGPTYEQIDPVRFIGNNSSGKMGVELAKRANELGADVTLVSGPITQDEITDNITGVSVRSAQEMYDAVSKYFRSSDIIIMAAAVSDYKPSRVEDSKIKKSSDSIHIELTSTKDILSSVGKIKSENQILIGFALETDNEIDNAKKKLKKKNLDFVVLNSLNDKGAGFGHDTNKITIIDKHNNIHAFELKSKSEVASDIFNKVLTLL